MVKLKRILQQLASGLRSQEILLLLLLTFAINCIGILNALGYPEYAEIYYTFAGLIPMLLLWISALLVWIWRKFIR